MLILNLLATDFDLFYIIIFFCLRTSNYELKAPAPKLNVLLWSVTSGAMLG